ncbi:plasmid mobilization protein [Caballeronia sp. LZ016]|uniref:plasmid mobilization protein n=1 Tax=Caballeronia sp. LZ016 TaxID=3038554 RepID=UPI002865D9CA|nr:hypothetical protein [Caballeronia sp. LZ016]MDR5738523.1 hypothetical protein [Caballeronia sp. LZ016]
MTTKPTERIVVFVTPAQKLAISKTADDLGVSVSELMRRAVLNFNATSEQIKAAGIVDRLRAPKTPDPLHIALRSVAAKAAAREAREAANANRRAASTQIVTGSPTPQPVLPADAEPASEDASLTGDGRAGH